MDIISPFGYNRKGEFMIFKNARIIDPQINLDIFADLLIQDGIIKKIDKNIDYDGEVYDFSNCVIAPSFCDTHSHFRDFGESKKETYETGTQVAIHGGYTHICTMANSNPPIDSLEMYNEVQEKIKDLPIDIFQSVNMTKKMDGVFLNDFYELKKAGVKCITDDGKPINSEKIMIEALKASEKYDMLLSLHEEDPKFIEHAGYDKTAPREAEISMIKRDIELVKKYGGHINIQHLSSKEGVELIRNAKKFGVKLYAEVTPTHLYFTRDDVVKYGTLLKVNPPVRTNEDRLALISGLKDGTIDMIASDHAPHTVEDKNLGEFKSKSGLISLETAFSSAIMKLYDDKHMSLCEIIQVMSINPRKVLNIEQKIMVGERADLVVFNPDEEYVFKKSAGKSSNSPLVGKTLKGKIKMTIKDGKILYNDKGE